jgi:hypothetical protein
MIIETNRTCSNLLCQLFNFKDIKVLLFFLILFLFFRPTIEYLLIDKFLIVFFLHIAKSPLLDFLNIVLVFYFLWEVLQNFGKGIPSFRVLCLFFFLAFIYSYYRFFNHVYVFEPFYNSSKISYFDSVLAAFFLQLVRFIAPVKTSRKQDSHSFIKDEAIKPDESNDLYGYNEYAKVVANKILGYDNFKGAFTIGINAEWGRGKTSFINGLKKHFPEEEVILIDFNPWVGYSKEDLIREFFICLETAINPHHSSLSRSFSKYADSLIQRGSSRWFDFARPFWIRTKSIDELKMELNYSISLLGKKVIVFIDDIDRLDSGEIFELLKLVRNTADFDSTYFVLAYDRGYLNSALRDINPYQHSVYLEKIIQLEITLPAFFDTKLLDYFFEKLSQYDSKGELGLSLMKRGKLIWPFSKWVKSVRDVNRLLNGLVLNFINNLDMADFYLLDLIRLEILRLKHPKIYQAIFSNNFLFFETAGRDGFEFRYVLKRAMTDSDDRMDLRDDNLLGTIFHFHLLDRLNDYGISKLEAQDVTNLVGQIFQPLNGITDDQSDLKSVIFVTKFTRYFAYRLVESNLRSREFRAFLKKDNDDFLAYVLSCFEKDQHHELRDRFAHITVYTIRQEFENVVSGILFLENKINFPLEVTLDSYFHFDKENLLNKLSDRNNRVSSRYYGNDVDGYTEFLKRLFKKEYAQSLFVSELLLESLKKNIQLPIPKKVVANIISDIFLGYLETRPVVNMYLFNLFYPCLFMDLKNDIESYKYDDNTFLARTALIGYLSEEKNLVTFLELIIMQRDDFEGPLEYKISTWPNYIWGNFDWFKTFIFEKKELSNPKVDEFILFLQKYDAQTKRGYIEFAFRDLEPAGAKDSVVR